MNRNVAVEYLDSYEIEKVQTALEDCFISLQAHRAFKPNMKVLIKPCLPYSTNPDLALTTHPAIVRAVVNVLTDLGAKCVLADSPVGRLSQINLDTVYFQTGMLEVANLTSCELNHNLSTTQHHLPDGIRVKDLPLMSIYDEVDAIVNIGKVKVDEKYLLFGATTSLLGLIPGAKKDQLLNNAHNLEEFNDLMLDIYSHTSQKLILNVLDGVVALERDNTPRLLSMLAVGESALSVDAMLCDALKIDKSKTIFAKGVERGLFDKDRPYRLISGNLSKFNLPDFQLYKTTEKNFKKLWRKNLHIFNQIQEKPVIDTNSCKGCCICSKICPTQAIEMKNDKNGELFAKIDYSKCIYCFKCLTACPYRVVKKRTPRMARIIDKDTKKFNNNN